jgi:hypothetical protein
MAKRFLTPVTVTVSTGTAPFIVSSTTVVTNLNADLLDGQNGSYYAPKASPALTGTPTAPTASAATNTTQIATTAYVKSQGYTANTGTVTSVGVSVPTGLSVSGSPITSSGTLTLSLASGYEIPTTSALAAKAPLASPTFTGTPAAPTATAGTNSTQIATTAFVKTAVSNLVDSAPTTLDTLNELAAALGDDPNFATTVTTALGSKQPLDADLTAIAALSGTSGLLKKTAANTWSLDTSSYLTGNQTITLSGDVSGSGTTSISVTVADDSHNHIIGNVDGLQTALDAKLASSSYTASDVLTKIKTVDGSGSGLDADLLDGLEVHTGTNNLANRIVRTDGSGYIQAGWINTTSGDNGTTAINRIYASQDGYIRYYTPSNFISTLGLATLASPTFTGTVSVSGDLLPATDNTGVVGNATYTWNNGQFTNLTIDGTLSVRAAIDLADSDQLRLGSSDDAKIWYDGSTNVLNVELESTATSMKITDNGTDRVVITRSTGDLESFGSISSEAGTKDNITTRTKSGYFQSATATTAEGWPETTNNWYHLISSTHSNISNYYSLQLAAPFFSNKLYFRSTNGSGTAGWSQIATVDQLGSGGLDPFFLGGM